MTIRATIVSLLSHFEPLTLVKQVFPTQKATQAFTHAIHENKPWMNVDEIEITAEDFA